MSTRKARALRLHANENRYIQMRRRLIEKFRFSEIRKDKWRDSQGLLSEQEKNQLRIRICIHILYRFAIFLTLLPVAIFRSISHIVNLSVELERLHFRPLRRVQRGSECVIDRQTWLVNGQNIILGDFVKISAFSSVMAGNVSTIKIGTNTIIGPGVTIVSFNHGYDLEDIPIRYQAWKDTSEHSIEIGEDVWVGANVVILPGSLIGSGSVIGAGVIVKGVVPPQTVLVNKQDIYNTAKVKRDRYAKSLYENRK
jgi:Acetyltransferase (isoleucine patch superfamily)